MATIEVNGRSHDLRTQEGTLLEFLREVALVTSVKDGCSPQGHCGCCTVLLNAVPRLACVTPLRRAVGSRVTTIEGIDPAVRDSWVSRFISTRASQCGFCTPGIITRLTATLGPAPISEDSLAELDRALSSHICRCTGWRPIIEAATCHDPQPANLQAANERASIESQSPQQLGAGPICGNAGFSDDTYRADFQVALVTGQGLNVADSKVEVRSQGRPTQLRRSTAATQLPIEIPEGDWQLGLQSTWVDQAYLEPDCAWVDPNSGIHSGARKNGGDFGAKANSESERIASRIAEQTQRATVAIYTRDAVTKLSPKRPPAAAGIDGEGRGQLVLAKTPGVVEHARQWFNKLGVDVPEIVQREVLGPPTSTTLRGAGWVEWLMLTKALEYRRSAPTESTEPPLCLQVGGKHLKLQPTQISIGPAGQKATVSIREQGLIISVDAGDPLDEMTLISYATGAAHQALGFVLTEEVKVGVDGEILDGTMRSFGILKAKETPPIEIQVEQSSSKPEPVSELVFVATAACVWISLGCPSKLPALKH